MFCYLTEHLYASLLLTGEKVNCRTAQDNLHLFSLPNSGTREIKGGGYQWVNVCTNLPKTNEYVIRLHEL